MAESEQEEVDARFSAWMAAAQRGDARAYERLLGDLLPALRRFVQLLVRDAITAEDVVQEVLLHIHRARHTYRPERPFGPWVRTIARHAAVDALRARTRRDRHEVELRDEMDAASAAQTMTGTLSPALAQALEALPRPQREAVALLHLEELSVAEAAARAGVSEGALKLRAHRARKALRAWLGGKAS